MADSKITALTALTSTTDDDLFVIVDDPAGTPVTKKITVANAFAGKIPTETCEGRLTAESGVPVSSTDQTSKTTLYFTPYQGNRIALYTSSVWTMYTFSEITISLGTLTSGANYDVFIYDSSGTLTTEMVAWTNNTTRATALTRQDGVLVKSGSTNKRYLGTFRTTSTTTTEDSEAKRFVYSYASRQPRKCGVSAGGGPSSYNTSSWRAWANTTSTAEWVIGQTDIPLIVGCYADFDTAGTYYVGADYDGNGTNFAAIYTKANTNQTAGVAQVNVPDLGYHYYTMNEWGTCTCYANILGMKIHC